MLVCLAAAVLGMSFVGALADRQFRERNDGLRIVQRLLNLALQFGAAIAGSLV